MVLHDNYGENRIQYCLLNHVLSPDSKRTYIICPIHFSKSCLFRVALFRAETQGQKLGNVVSNIHCIALGKLLNLCMLQILQVS